MWHDKKGAALGAVLLPLGWAAPSWVGSRGADGAAGREREASRPVAAAVTRRGAPAVLLPVESRVSARGTRRVRRNGVGTEQGTSGRSCRTQDSSAEPTPAR